MNSLVVLLLALAAVSSGQLLLYPPLLPYPAFPGLPRNDEYAASLGGAPVAWYNRRTGPFARETRAGSLGNGKVGIYGNDRLPIARAPLVPIYY